MESISVVAGSLTIVPQGKVSYEMQLLLSDRSLYPQVYSNMMRTDADVRTQR